MMTLPTVSTIEAGTSILFLGAGFSAEAKNTNGEDIKDVSALITYLLNKVGITSSDGYDLDTAAEEFQKIHGDEAAVVALHSNFRVKTYTGDQATICSSPGSRTSNSSHLAGARSPRPSLRMARKSWPAWIAMPSRP